MTVTIGAFSCNALTAQPYGYDGEARRGLTSRAFRVSGLLTATQWSALLTLYDTWRNMRINDEDSLKSQTVGTTVSLTSTAANGVAFINVACWFAEAPSGEQLGAYVSASAVLVDAAQALAALLRERELSKEAEQAVAEEPVDCAKIAADLQRRKDETDCELTALAGGLADDFAGQDVTREITDKTAQLGARGGGNADTIAGLDAQLNVQARTAELAAAGTYAEDLADLDAQLQVVNRTAELSVAGTYAEDLADLDAQLEVATRTAQVAVSPTYANTLADLDAQQQITDKTAQLDALGTHGQDIADLDAQIEVANKTASNAVAATYAADLAELDLARQVIDTEARAALYTGTGAADIASLKTAEIDIEIAESDARVTALGPKLDALKASRSLLALYERYLTEDLPDFGSETVGPVTLTLLKPAESRSAGPSVSLTATGNTYISGALGTLVAKDIEGYTVSLTASSLMSWYDTIVTGTPATGSWFPSAAPSIRAEKVLVGGLVGTRYIVNVTLVQIT